MCSSAILPVDTVLPALTPRFLAGVRGHHNDSNSDSNSDIEEKKEDPFWTVREEPQRASYTETEPEPKIPSTSTPCFHHEDETEDETETARWLWSPTNDRARATEATLPGGCNNDEAIHLFASFSSSPQTSLWHYSHDSPRLAPSKQRRWSIAAPVVSPSTRGGGNANVDGTFSGNDNDTGTTAPPEPLPWMPDPRRSLSAKQSDEDRPPTLIRCRRLSVCSIITVGSYLSNGNHNHNSDNNIVDNHNGNHNGNGNHDSHPHRHHDYGASVSCHYADEDDEEVSLLADDPDDDDDDVLPHATYDVLANLFDDI